MNTHSLRIASIIVVACCSTPASAAENAALNLVFSCRADNDLYRVVTQSDRAYPRFDTPAEAVAGAPEGAGLLILADGYPQEKTKVNAAFFEAAAAKGQRLYVEYPAHVPGFGLKDPAYVATGPYGSVLERTVITSAAFGPRLDSMRILVINDCHYLPVAPRPETVHMVLARVAGYATAKLGLPPANAPILFELPDARAWVATTKLSQFASARYAPTEAWGPVWQTILQRLQPGKTVPALKWTPAVRPRYTRDEPLLADAQVQAIDRAARWYRQSRLLVAKDWGPWDPNQNPGIQPLPMRWSVGDGSLGIAECYISKRVFQDGSQALQPSVRADCTAESAMGLALGAAVTKEASYETIAKNLNDFLWFRSVMAAQGPQADPQRPSYGMLGHNAASPGNTHYWGDDNARVLLSTIASSSLLRSDRWDEAMLRTMLANFRLTGLKGYHAGGLIPQDDLERNGWQHYWNWDGTDLSPHYQSYKWAVFLWLYDKTRFQPLLERTRTGIRLMMEAYPRGWSAECGRMEEERAHMLLPLAWLVRVEDTPEHRQWLETMARFIFDTMTPGGAIPQMVDKPYAANAQYGTGEAPIVYETGDPGTDLLYTMNFAFSGMHEAAAATGDTRYAEAAERMAKFLIRAQTQSKARPELSGTWFRAFDFSRWDYYGSDGDAGWGVWTTESGWTHSWITATLAMRQMKTSLWEISQDRRVKPRFDELRREMLPDAALGKPAVNRTDHAARGKPVQLAHPYHSAYTAGGPGALTDGKRGGTSIPLSNWQGFEGVDLDATIDLGQVTTIRSLSTTYLQNTPLGIYLPTEVKYLVSVDGRQFDVVATLAGDVGDQKPGPFIRAFSAELTNVSARHLRVQAKSIRTIPAGHPAAGAKVWLFADEIMANASAAEGLMPSGSVETTDQAGRVANDAEHNLTSKAKTEPPGTAPASDQLYDEAYRPQFHFTYKKGWMSDINGLFHCAGEYHFFSSHNPTGPGLDYGNIHLGHAVSKDLIHWTELPPALAPDKDGPIFSGSAVVDWKNTSGLQTGKEPVLIAFYTAARYMLPAKGDGVQSMAYSNDRGRTWTKYAGNPVLPAITHYNRDPKVFWHEPTGKWVMVITLSCADNWLLGRDGDYRFAIFSSSDLKQWKEMSRFDMPRGLDCPDMFELPVDSKAGNRRWVFSAGDGTHAIGTFDGTRFVPTDGIRPPLVNWPEKGANGYAAQTFSDIPAADGRRIQIAWLRALEHGGYPGMPFNQQALFPVELTLRTVDGRIQLFREPVREVEQLHGRKWEWTQHTIRPGENLLSGIQGELFELRAEIEPGDASEISFRVRGATLRYDPTRKTLSCLDKTMSAGTTDGRLRLQLLIDRTTLEIFADRGRTSLSFFLAPSTEQAPLGLIVAGGELKVRSLTVWEMKSIWPRNEK